MNRLSGTFVGAMLAAPLLWGWSEDVYEKPFLEWTEKQAESVLTKGPWTQSHVLVFTDSNAGAITRGTSVSADTDVQTRNYLRAHWLSSRPVRKAFARRIVTANPEVDLEPLTEFANRPMEEAIISLTVDSKPAGAPSIQSINAALGQLEPGEVLSRTTLETKGGKKVSPLEFQPPQPDGLGARFVFPRTLPDGSPLLTPNDREVRFMTRLKLGRQTVHLRLKFKLADMTYQGQLEY